jgi:hypothetical protein
MALKDTWFNPTNRAVYGAQYVRFRDNSLGVNCGHRWHAPPILRMVAFADAGKCSTGVHVGDPTTIGISEIALPDDGDAVPIGANEQSGFRISDRIRSFRPSVAEHHRAIASDQP